MSIVEVKQHFIGKRKPMKTLLILSDALQLVGSEVKTACLPLTAPERPASWRDVTSSPSEFFAVIDRLMFRAKDALQIEV